LPIALVFHLLAIVIWVGGMFFAHQALRPAAASVLEAPQRLTLWVNVFARFFPWVWLSVISILASGYWMLLVPFGGFANSPLFVHAMNGLGLVMMLIFAYVYFVPYQRLRENVAGMRWPEAGKTLGQIRMLVGANLSIGLINISIAAAGKYYL
jgi:uncharacterized membrane protein